MLQYRVLPLLQVGFLQLADFSFFRLGNMVYLLFLPCFLFLLWLNSLSFFPAGLGHTMAEYNFGVSMALKYNLIKVHPPVVCAHGNQLPCSDFFGLGLGELYSLGQVKQAIEDRHLKEIIVEGTPDDKRLQDALKRFPETNLVFTFTKAKSSSNYKSSRGWWLGQMSLARQTSVWERNVSTAKYDPTCINVALHLRRGDIVRKPKQSVLKKRFTNNEFYINTFKTIRSLFPNNKVVGYFFSQGEPKEFEDIAKELPEAHIFFRGTPLGDFRGLMESDILVTAKSGYSHLAAVMSEGVMVVALPFWSSYDYLPDVVMANEKSNQGLNPEEFVTVWNARDANLRKGAVAAVPDKPEVEPEELVV